MVRTFRTAAAVALAGAIAVAASPVLAQSITLPFIGDLAHPDLDPIHMLNPDPAPAAAPEAKPMMKHHHHHKAMMKKKKMMMRKKM